MGEEFCNDCRRNVNGPGMVMRISLKGLGFELEDLTGVGENEGSCGEE